MNDLTGAATVAAVKELTHESQRRGISSKVKANQKQKKSYVKKQEQ